MSSVAHIHVVSKRDNTKHATCTYPDDTAVREQLAPSSVRARVTLISLSSNNLSYARGGTFLHWWDAYPVPEGLPPPYNDRSEWGIVPAWGFAQVTDSTIPSIAVDSMLWGMWPTSSDPVTLQLAPFDSPTSGLWTETSPHRSQLMTMYNHYEHHPDHLDDASAAFRCLFPVFQSAHLLNKAVFPARGIRPIQPLGMPQLPWTDEAADLTGAVVVSLSAGSKTGRSLAWQLARNRNVVADGPLALLQLTSSPGTLASFAGGDGQAPPLPIKSAAYTDPLDTATSWMREFNPTRVVVMDFGAPARVLDAVMESLSGTPDSSSSVTVLQVGQEPKVLTEAETAAFQEQFKRVGKVQYNSSGVRDRVMESLGAAEYTRGLDQAWEKCYTEKGFGEIRVRRLAGVEGRGGIEGAWQDLCDGKVEPGVGIVVDLKVDP